MKKDRQFVKFCLYGFLKNLRFYDVFLLLFFLENGIGYAQIGVLYAAREIVINIAEIPSGIIADSYGRKSTLLGAFLLYIVSFGVFYYSTDFALLFIGMVLMGGGDAFRSGAHKGMIMDYLKMNNWEEYKVQYYGETRSWSQKGSAVSALLAGIIVFYTGNFRTVYMIAVIPYILNFINIYTYPQTLNHSLKRKKKAQFSLSQVLKSVVQTLKKGRVIQLINSSALHSAYLKSVKDYIQPLIVNLALLLPFGLAMEEKSKSGLVVGVVYFIIYLMTSYASKNSSRFLAFNFHNVEQKTLLYGLFFGLSCGVLYALGLWWLALILFILIYIVENLRLPIMTGFLVDNVPNEILTSVISTQSFYNTIATALISIFLGVCAEYYGIGIALMAVSGVLIILTMAIEAGIRKQSVV